jgi:hypothetical protein
MSYLSFDVFQKKEIIILCDCPTANLNTRWGFCDVNAGTS